MRIYLFTSKLNFRTAGGSVEEFDLIARTLQKQGNEVVAVTAFSDSNDIPEQLPYRLIEERIPHRDLVGIGRGIYALLKKYEQDADFYHIDGHLFLYGAGAYRRFGGTVPVAALFNRELGCWPPDRSTLISSREAAWPALKRRVRWIFERFVGMPLAGGIDLRAFISPMYMQMYERFGLRSRGNNSIVLGDPTDLCTLMVQAGVTERSYRERIDAGRPVRIFYSSRMVAGKGFDLILAGFARVSDKERFRLVLGGSGPEEGRVHRMAQDLGIADFVEFTGWMPKERLLEEYRKADIFVQVGWRPEGTSISLLYALAFGVPSIVPEGSGLAWQAGSAALTVPDGNHDALAQAFERLGGDTALRAQLSDNCYRRLADEQMDHERMIGKWLAMMRVVREQNN